MKNRLVLMAAGLIAVMTLLETALLVTGNVWDSLISFAASLLGNTIFFGAPLLILAALTWLAKVLIVAEPAELLEVNASLGQTRTCTRHFVAMAVIVGHSLAWAFFLPVSPTIRIVAAYRLLLILAYELYLGMRWVQAGVSTLPRLLLSCGLAAISLGGTKDLIWDSHLR